MKSILGWYTGAMKRSHLIVLCLIMLVLFAGGLATYLIRTASGDPVDSDSKKTLISNDSQVFTDLDGNSFTLEQFEGKVRVVNTWASWTPFSKQELQDLESLAAEYSAQDVVFIAVNRKEPKETAKQFLETIQEFEQLVFVIDINDTYFKSVGGYAMPETVFYDQDGNIVFHKRGSMSKEEIRGNLQDALHATE